jgi:hypothetical protein
MSSLRLSLLAVIALAGCGGSGSSGHTDAAVGDAPLQVDAPQQADGALHADGPLQADGPLSQDGPRQQDGGGCIPAKAPGAGGMDPGSDCHSCHAGFTIGGTLYSQATGGAVVGGATVRVTGSDLAVLDLVTGSDGIFSSQQAVAFPATVEVSKCPDTQVMVATITQGSCSASSCHTSGAQVHLP